MKRKLIGLLFVCMLFSGCGNNSSQPLQTESLCQYSGVWQMRCNYETKNTEERTKLHSLVSVSHQRM